MSNINQDLLQALATQLGVTHRQVYRRIDEVVRETFYERHDAALVLAARHKLPIHKYSTVDDRRRIAALHGRTTPTATTSWDEPRRGGSTPTFKAIKVDLGRMTNPALRTIVKRDIRELNDAAAAIPRSAKMCMVHAGSIAECLLLDHVEAQPAPVLAAAFATLTDKPKSKDPRTWPLDTLVKVSMHLTPPLREDVLTGAKQVKDWRNLVHPGLEVRAASKVTVSQRRAEGALAFLGMLVEDLEQKP